MRIEDPAQSWVLACGGLTDRRNLQSQRVEFANAQPNACGLRGRSYVARRLRIEPAELQPSLF